MRHVSVIVRYLAVEVLALLDLAREHRMDALWFLRKGSCDLQLPDGEAVLQPESVVGDTAGFIGESRTPRVEVLELHNYVFQRLLATASRGKVSANLFVEIQFTAEDEYCLVLTSEPSNIDSKRFYSDGDSKWNPLSDLFGDIDV